MLSTILTPLPSYDVKRMVSVSLSRPLSKRRNDQRGFSLIELLIVIAIILIILAIAIPQMNNIRQNAQEMAAVAQIRTIQQAEMQYYSQFGDYATALTQLGPPAGNGATEGPAAAGLIPQNLASGANSGYVFTVSQGPTGYSVLAVPKVYKSTGRRTFYSDSSGIIRQNWGQDPATPQSAEIK
ncbi:MAG TPA: prepilin-type N-terminal cleavage/methylation domain-containing protein [Bryobacteraceae bacterium]|jgi:prepilin-type N-terminal cleavage/methylation domain-containing protein|nr:prepilin-type N-terminal cleavage/methylation domain-containing protein [Bryobacteraceae bacterium]